MDRLTRFSPARSTAWLALALAMAAIGYSANALADREPDADVLFRWSTAIQSVVMYALILGIAVAIAQPVDRSVHGVRRPDSWSAAARLVAVGFGLILAVSFALTAAGLDAGDEQGLVPDGWEAGKAAPFAANFLVIAVVAPIVEETVFRGVGFAIVRQYAGSAAAIAITALLFGLAHGLLVALPVLVVFGIVLATVRSRTGSVYPPMVLHGVFNGIALVAGVTGVGT